MSSEDRDYFTISKSPVGEGFHPLPHFSGKYGREYNPAPIPRNAGLESMTGGWKYTLCCRPQELSLRAPPRRSMAWQSG